MQGHVGVVGLLLSRSTALLKISDAKGQNCLHVAAKNGHYEMVQVLLGQGSDYTTADKEGWTPLHGAAQVSILPIVQAFLDTWLGTQASTMLRDVPDINGN